LLLIVAWFSSISCSTFKVYWDWIRYSMTRDGKSGAEELTYNKFRQYEVCFDEIQKPVFDLNMLTFI